MTVRYKGQPGTLKLDFDSGSKILIAKGLLSTRK